jgi:hypothetical protein
VDLIVQPDLDESEWIEDVQFFTPEINEERQAQLYVDFTEWQSQRDMYRFMVQQQMDLRGSAFESLLPDVEGNLLKRVETQLATGAEQEAWDYYQATIWFLDNSTKAGI